MSTQVRPSTSPTTARASTGSAPHAPLVDEGQPGVELAGVALGGLHPAGVGATTMTSSPSPAM